jgi:predicted sugar kinase
MLMEYSKKIENKINESETFKQQAINLLDESKKREELINSEIKKNNEEMEKKIAIIEDNFGKKLQEMSDKIIDDSKKKIEYEKNNSIEYMKNQDIPAVGMSSFGPTCFGITDENVKSIKNDLEDFLGEDSTVIVTNGKNHGSIIR